MVGWHLSCRKRLMKNGWSAFIMSKKVDEKWFVRGDFEKVDEKRLMKGEKIVGQNGKYGWSTKIIFCPRSAHVAGLMVWSACMLEIFFIFCIEAIFFFFEIDIRF